MALSKFNSIEELLASLSRPDLEVVVIGSIILETNEDTIAALNTLRAEAFTNKDYRKLFTICKHLQTEERAIDLTSVYTELLRILPKEEALRLNNVSMDASNRVASTANLSQQVGELREYYSRRELVKNRHKAILGYGDLATPLEATLNAEAEAKETLQTDRAAKYSHLLKIETEEERIERMRKKPTDLKTPYMFSFPSGDEEQLTLPSGALTFICAPTSHGKSTFLQNIALQIAQGAEEGDTLYFSFEEDDDNVYMQLLNKYSDVELCKNASREHNNLGAIADYYRTGYAHFVKKESLEAFNRNRGAFNSLLKSGKLRLYYEDYDSNELAEAIKEISRLLHNRGGKLKAVFIDYIQLLTINGSKAIRREELRLIAQSLRKLSIALQIPIVVAAQLNREVNSPIDFANEKIAEAADLEREANTIVCLWNTGVKARGDNYSKKDLEELETRFNFTLGDKEKVYIYAKMTKRRYGKRGAEAAFLYNGNTGIIEPNVSTELEEGSLPLEDPDTNPEEKDSSFIPF